MKPLFASLALLASAPAALAEEFRLILHKVVAEQRVESSDELYVLIDGNRLKGVLPDGRGDLIQVGPETRNQRVLNLELYRGPKERYFSFGLKEEESSPFTDRELGTCKVGITSRPAFFFEENKGSVYVEFDETTGCHVVRMTRSDDPGKDGKYLVYLRAEPVPDPLRR